MIKLNNILKEWLNEIKYTPDQAVKILSKFGIRNADRLSDDELKKQFRKIAFKHHPDAGGKHEDFIQINAAYETLTQHLKPVQNSTDDSDDSDNSTSSDAYGYSSDEIKEFRKRAVEVKKVFDAMNADSRFTDLTKGKDPAMQFFISDLTLANRPHPYLKTLVINLFDGKGGLGRIQVFYDTEENKYVANGELFAEFNSVNEMVNQIYNSSIEWLSEHRKTKKTKK